MMWPRPPPFSASPLRTGFFLSIFAKTLKISLLFNTHLDSSNGFVLAYAYVCMF